MRKIERIYITKGDNLFDYNGVRTDKVCGVMIDGGIYWLSRCFSTVETLGFLLERVDVKMDTGANGKITYGQWLPKKNGTGRQAVMNGTVTKINKHHDEVFNESSYYMKKAVKNNDGSYWWNESDVLAVINGTRMEVELG